MAEGGRVETGAAVRNAGTGEPKRVCDRGEERSRVRSSHVVYLTKVRAELKRVRSFDFGKVVYKVLDWNMRVGGRRPGGNVIHSAEVDEMLCLLAQGLKTLANIAEPEVIN